MSCARFALGMAALVYDESAPSRSWGRACRALFHCGVNDQGDDYGAQHHHRHTQPAAERIERRAAGTRIHRAGTPTGMSKRETRVPLIAVALTAAAAWILWRRNKRSAA